MARVMDATFIVSWPTHVAFDGHKHGGIPVRQLLAAERAFLAYAGSKENGWAIYLIDTVYRDKLQQVSPLFCADFGDTRRAMIEACIRAYGAENNPIVNLGRDHPEEVFRWSAY